jgi:hypothetical protein
MAERMQVCYDAWMLQILNCWHLLIPMQFVCSSLMFFCTHQKTNLCHLSVFPNCTAQVPSLAHAPIEFVAITGKRHFARLHSNTATCICGILRKSLEEQSGLSPLVKSMLVTMINGVY